MKTKKLMVNNFAGVDVKGLMAELEERQKLNKIRNDALEDLKTLDGDIKESLADVEYLEQKLSSAKDRLVKNNKMRHGKANEIQIMRIANEQEIKDQIENAQRVNSAQ